MRKTALEREFDCLDEDLENGVISQKEYNKLVRELEMSDNQERQEEAQRAYDEIMGR